LKSRSNKIKIKLVSRSLDVKLKVSDVRIYEVGVIKLRLSL